MVWTQKQIKTKIDTFQRTGNVEGLEYLIRILRGSQLDGMCAEIQDEIDYVNIKNGLNDALRCFDNKKLQKLVARAIKTAHKDRLQTLVAQAQTRVSGNENASSPHRTPPLSKNVISQLKCLSNPPMLIKAVVSAVMMLLGYSKADSESWEVALHCLGDSSLYQRMQTLDKTKLSRELVKEVSVMLEPYSVQNTRCVSLEAASLHKWVLDQITAIQII